MKQPVTVSNLTLSLWLDFVRPALRSLNMLEEVPAKDDTHEYTAEVIEEATAEELTHCMTVACFNAHGNGKYATLEEAAQMVYQLEVSIKYRPATAEALATVRNALAIKVAETITATETTETTETETTENKKEEETMFPNLTKAINAHYDTAAEKFASDLLTVTAGYALDHAYYRDLMTPKAFDECKALDPAETLPETVRAKMTARFTRQNERNRAERLAKLTRAENAEPLENASISVEWKRSAMWGSNPTAVVIANYDANHATEGRASGCGYDKESAAIATAVNASPSIMRILYEHAENGGSFPYSVYTYAGLPYFDGGCGVSCFRNVFAACGYRWEDGAHRKTFDVYTLTRA